MQYLGAMPNPNAFHILVADDEKLFVDAISDHLPAHFPNAQLRVAYDGMEALRLAQQNPPVHLLFTDLRMPGLDGLGLLENLQRIGFAAPVAVMTAFGSLEVEQKARELGAGYFLRKPIDLNALVAVAETEAAKFSTNPIALTDLLRSLVIGGQSGDVSVRLGEQEGSLLFRRGLLIDAQVGELAGEEAALAILSWPNPTTLGFRSRLPDQEPTIEKNLNTLMSEARKLRLAAAHRRAAALPNDLPDSAAPKGGPSTTGSTQEPLFKEPIMANIRESLEEAMRIDGAIAVALVDFNSGMCLGAAGGNAQFNIEMAAAGNTAVVRAKMKVMKDLGLKDTVEDILITLGKQYHLLRPLTKAPNLFMYLATDRDKSNLALARHRLTAIEEALQVG